MKYIKSHEKFNDTAFVEKMSKKYNVLPCIIDLLISRNVDTEKKFELYFDPKIENMHDPFLLKNMSQIVDEIKEHINKKNKILVFGDYDVDGITASAILVKAIEELGGKPEHFLPNRYDDGYGLTIETAKRVIAEYEPNLILTVDCGITAVEEVEYIKGLGIDIIITDHHEPMERLPDCLVLNPKTCEYPTRDLCGAGVALKLVQALGLELDKYLPLCAIATIADIVELLGENRAIVALGLKLYKLLPIGLGVMLSANDLGDRQPKASEIAYKIAPKLNASGRMGDAETSYKLYVCTDKIIAKNLVTKITKYNKERQSLCTMVYDDVKAELNQKDIFELKSIVSMSPKWNVGILGIVAARLADEYNRPTFLFTESDGILTGSGRSVNGVNIHELLCSLDDLLEKYGGHTMAAGLTIKSSNYDTFSVKCENYVKEHFTNADLVPTKIYDIEVTPAEVSLKLAESINAMEPCGHKNQTPLVLLKPENAIIMPMKNHIEHIIVKYKNFSLLAFNSFNYYYALKDNPSTNIVTDIILESYKGKKKISGIIKSIDYSDVYRPIDEDVIYVNYINQLLYNNKNIPHFDVYNREQLLSNILQMQNDVHGTLIISNDYNSYINYKNIYDGSNIIQNRIFEIIDQSGLNTILLSPKNFNNFDTFKKIIFLDPIINMGYLVELKKHTNAKLLLPYKNVSKYKIFEKISLDREVFGKYFYLFEKMQNKDTNIVNEYELFAKEVQNNKEYNYLQFMVCLYVFKELEIIKLDTQYRLSINKTIKSELNKSSFYNRIKSLLRG